MAAGRARRAARAIRREFMMVGGGPIDVYGLRDRDQLRGSVVQGWSLKVSLGITCTVAGKCNLCVWKEPPI